MILPGSSQAQDNKTHLNKEALSLFLSGTSAHPPFFVHSLHRNHVGLATGFQAQAPGGSQVIAAQGTALKHHDGY